MIFESPVQGALWLAARGLPVFPFKWNEKGEPTPVFDAFWDKATTNPTTLNKRFADKTRLPAVATGNGLLVVDIDVKDGKKGDESLCLLELQHGELPRTFTIRSRSGGYHYFFNTPRPLASSVCKIAPGVDTRGEHGFVISVGTPNYSVEIDAPIADAPEWLLALCQAPRETNEAENAPDIDWDKPEALARGLEWAKTAPIAQEGAGGDQHTYAVATRMRQLGVARTTALDMLLEHFNPRCEPPWLPADMEVKVANAYRYAQEPAASALAATEFPPVISSAKPQAERKGLYFDLYRDIAPDLTSIPLIEGYLDQGAFSVLYGQSNTGKTFVALDFSFHIAAGRAWNGARVEQGGVVYVASEGGKGIRKRIAALRSHFAVADTPLAVVPCRVNLLRPRDDIEALGKLIENAAIALGCPIKFLVIDTLSRAMAGGNENASEDMSLFVDAIDRLRAISGAHAMVVHHSGKDEAKGARGHSGLRAATDTEIEITKNRLEIKKQRDDEYIAPKPFALKTIEVGVNVLGKPVRSCVVVWGGAGPEFEEIALTPEETRCLDALEEAVKTTGQATTAEVGTALEGLGLPPADSITVKKWLIGLETKGVILRHGKTKGSGWRIV